MSMTARRLILVVLLHGCRAAAGGARQLPVEVIVEGDFGGRLSGVPIRVNGRVVGRSDATGVLRTAIFGSPGTTVRISQECPNEHPKAEEEATLRVRRYEIAGSAPPLSVVLRCRLERRIAAVVVRTGTHEGVVVHIDGEMVATTNEQGIAHLSQSVSPGTELLVELDASRYPQLRPQRASRVVSIADSHDVFVIDQHYESVRRASGVVQRRRRILKIE